ncbi:MAG: hypothetical protein PHE79_04660 [Eubacteriales bacterium]|jgi:hypothetical protein|nr:hypothetical protein [Eubacteriales bacterium]
MGHILELAEQFKKIYILNKIKRAGIIPPFIIAREIFMNSIEQL